MRRRRVLDSTFYCTIFIFTASTRTFVDIKFDAVIAWRPSIFRPRERECAACGRACSDSRGLVDFIIRRKIFAEIFRDPHSLDACALSQTLALPARVNFRRVRRECRRRLPEAIFRKTHYEPFRCGVRFHFGALDNFGRFRQFKRNALEQIAFRVLHCRNVFDNSNAGCKPALDHHPVGRRLLAVNVERLKFSRGHIDFFFAKNVVMLLHFQFASQAIEVPCGAFFQRKRRSSSAAD